MTQTWMNGDGLYVRFGTKEAEVSIGGDFSDTVGDQHVTYVELDLTTVTATAGTIIDDAILIPKGAFIEEVKVTNRTAATGSGATLNLGLVKFDRTTAIDADGLLAAAPLTDWNTAGETLVYRVGVSGAGALMGTKTAFAGYLCADYDTAAITAGSVAIEIRYSFNNQV